MAKHHLMDFGKRQAAATFFDRRELQQLLNLYSRRVASGEWRDYAIDQRNGSAVFSIFRHTHEQPLFSITKRAHGDEYLVHSGPQRLTRSATLADALAVLERKRGLRVVS